MKIRYTITLTLLMLLTMGAASAQTNPNQKLSSSYVESCIQSQLQIHQNLKEISQNDFRAYCECTAKQLSSTLSSTQLDELLKTNQSPKWLKSAEATASKSCLKPVPKTQA